MTKPKQSPARTPRRPKPARASRFVVGGGAVGAGLLMVGAMAAASPPPSPQPQTSVVGQIGVTGDLAPATQIVIVLPDPSSSDSLPSVSVSSVQATAPAKPEPVRQSDPTKAPVAVAESGGS